MVFELSDVEIHRFRIEDGIPLVSDRFLNSIIEDMIESSLDRTIFFSTPTKKAQINWMNSVKSLRYPLWLAIHKPSALPAMTMWLTDVKIKTAYIHFHVMSEFRSRGAFRIGTVMLDTILHYCIGDKPRFNAIYGLIPNTNREAIRFALRIGGRILTNVPSACYILDQRRSISGTFFYKERFDGDNPITNFKCVADSDSPIWG